MSNQQPFEWAALPEIVRDYLKPHIVQDFATAVTFLAEDVIVIDNGETLRGRDATLKVFEESAQQYEVTTTLNSISQPADEVWEIGTHLSGTFPGGEVDLRMLFTVVDNAIKKLEFTV